MKILQPVLLILMSATLYCGAEVPNVVRERIPDAERVGSTRVSVFLWDLYDIYLYSPRGSFDPDQAFAMRLSYLRDFQGDMIAQKSIEEMRRQGISEVKLASWYGQLMKIFPDVTSGSELLGIFQKGGPTLFYQGSEFLGQVLDPQFGESFSGIWLGAQSSQPEVRTELIGNESAL